MADAFAGCPPEDLVEGVPWFITEGDVEADPHDAMSAQGEVWIIIEETPDPWRDGGPGVSLVCVADEVETALYDLEHNADDHPMVWYRGSETLWFATYWAQQRHGGPAWVVFSMVREEILPRIERTIPEQAIEGATIVTPREEEDIEEEDG